MFYIDGNRPNTAKNAIDNVARRNDGVVFIEVEISHYLRYTYQVYLNDSYIKRR